MMANSKVYKNMNFHEAVISRNFRIKPRLFLYLVVSLILSNTTTPPARSETAQSEKTGGGSPTLSELDLAVHDVGNVYLMVSNQGPIGIEMETNSGTGFFPSNTSNNYVFGTGLWFGARFDADGNGNLDKVFVSAYGYSSNSEFREGPNELSRDDPLTRIFDSTEADDIEDWPERFSEMDSLGQYTPFIRSDQDLVATYTTKDEIAHWGPLQLPLEVTQRSMAFKSSLAGQAIIFSFDIENWGNEVLEDAWVGYDSDMDIGASFSADLASFIRDRVTPEGDTIHVNMGYAWDSDFTEGNFTGDPGFVGIAYLRSPGNPNDGIDNDSDGLIDESPFNDIDDDGDGQVDEPDEVDELGLINYSKHCGMSVPCEVHYPQTDQDGYYMLSCLSETNPDTSSQIVCLESTTPSDIRFMISSGSFDWLAGQTQQVVMAMVFAHPTGNRDLPFVGDPPRPDPNDDDLVELLAVKETVQRLFDLDFKPAEPPPAPNLTLIPGDCQVTLLWDDLSLRTPDPDYESFVEIDPEYRHYDFQGFRIWRSRTGEYSHLGDPDDPDYPLTPEAIQQNNDLVNLDLTLLAQYDLADGITTDSSGIVCTDSTVLGRNLIVYNDCDTFNLGSDTGLRFSYIDHGDFTAPLRNGFRYYYAVTAYDYNSYEFALSRLSLDSGVSLSLENSVIPRSNASSFVDAFSRILHVDESGSALDDTSSIFISSDTGELHPPEMVHASNALVDFEFVPGMPEKISDDHYTLVLGEFEVMDEITNKIHYVMEDAFGDPVNVGIDPSFDLRYDGTDQILSVLVFNPDDMSEVIFTSELTFSVDTTSFIIPDPLVHLIAEGASGADIFDSLGTIFFSNYLPAGFRASDIRMEWVEVGVESLTLMVSDLDNMIEIPFCEEIIDTIGLVVESELASNWSFLPVTEPDLYQPGGRYFLTDRMQNRLKLWISGIEIFIPSMMREPLPGDIWTLRQVAMRMEINTEVVPFDTTYLDAQRPPVPGTRYRLDTESGGQDAGEVDLSEIRVVPNPYLASAAWDIGPSQRRLEFINLPPECTIRIYTISGLLVRVLAHTSSEGGTEAYDLLTREGISLASGNYYYHVTTPDGQTHLGRFAVVQ
jgi:hypothetical protein